MPLPSLQPDTVAELMVSFRHGDREAAGRLVEIFYPELRRIAAARMRAERLDHTLQPTALVHQLYLELVKVKALRSTSSGGADEKSAFLGLAALAIAYRRFQFTTLVYFLIMVHAWILFVGGHYTYAEVPLFNWIRDHFHLARNDFARVGHFAQGFVPALIARELFVRLRVVSSSGWRFFIIILICMGISALYELLEWVTALVSGSAATAFLGTQGDILDTQEDMFMCLIGAVCALLFMRPWQDRQLRKIRVSG